MFKAQPLALTLVLSVALCSGCGDKINMAKIESLPMDRLATLYDRAKLAPSLDEFHPEAILVGQCLNAPKKTIHGTDSTAWPSALVVDAQAKTLAVLSGTDLKTSLDKMTAQDIQNLLADERDKAEQGETANSLYLSASLADATADTRSLESSSVSSSDALTVVSLRKGTTQGGWPVLYLEGRSESAETADSRKVVCYFSIDKLAKSDKEIEACEQSDNDIRFILSIR